MAVIAPHSIADGGDDPVLSIAWPRPDLRIAALEFLLGILMTAFPPEDAGIWRDYWNAPPDQDILQSAFARIAHAFDLDGDGPRFMQDRNDLQADPIPVERLFIDAPGEQTLRKNTDMMVHRGRFSALGRPAAAMALYTLQAWAPSGGAGNRVGLRGGGPLVTMAVPSAAGHGTLWHMLWANVQTGERPAPEEYPGIFPWLTGTLTSEGARKVYPRQNAHPLQCWWSMPRRIRLDFTEGAGLTACDLTGQPDSVTIRSWRQRPHGANYEGWGGIHPLTPAYRAKEDAEILPMHPQPGGIGYRDWLGLVVSDTDKLRYPAKVIETWRTSRAIDVEETRAARILAAGYDMDNMKARAFVETEMPLLFSTDAAVNTRREELSSHCVRAAVLASDVLRNAVKTAVFLDDGKAKANSVLFDSVRAQLYARTENAFFALLERCRADDDETARALRLEWRDTLKTAVRHILEEYAPLDIDNPRMVEKGLTVSRQLRARQDIGNIFAGRGKLGEKLCQILQIPLPEKSPGPKSGMVPAPGKRGRHSKRLASMPS